MPTRLALESDADALAVIYIRTLRDAWGGAMPDDFRHESDVAARSEKLRNLIATEKRIWMVCTVADEIVAYGALEAVPDEGPEAGEVAVFGTVEEHRRRGHGGVMMQALEAEAARRGWTRLCLWVVAENVPARSFYESQGYAFDGTERVENRLGFPATVVRYRKSLSRGSRPR